MKCFSTLLLLLSIAGVTHAQLSDFKHINFSKADSMAALYPHHTLTNIKGLSDKLTAGLQTPVEKFRAIYKWVCGNIENDAELYLRNKSRREKLKDSVALKAWNTEFTKVVFDKLVKKHRTVCTGYAYLVRELAFHAGITAVIVDGYGRTAVANIGGKGIVNHSWSAVKLNDKWYLCDPTWSSGVLYDQKNFVKTSDNIYFLSDPALFIRNHYPVNTSWTLLENSPTLDEYLHAPLVYRDIHTFGIQAFSTETFEVTVAKGKSLILQFTIPSEISIHEIELSIQIAGIPKLVSPVSYRNETGQYIEYTFTSKGKYPVHVLFDGRYICTYTVHVK